jgi:glucokinase
MAVVRKFTDILARQTGNFALTCLPYGGIYLCGGVCNGIRQYLKEDSQFMDTFYESKGMLKGIVKNFPVFLLKADVELGILGAEEYAYRMLCDARK